MEVELIEEEFPLMFKENPIFYKEGHRFEVVDTKDFPQIGKMYRLKFAGCVFDGYYKADAFKEV